MSKKQEKIKCIAYLSTMCSVSLAARKEDGQLKCIERYAKKHNYEIVEVIRRHGFGWKDVLEHFQNMANKVRKKEAKAVLVINSLVVSESIEDIFRKAGMIQAAGGKLVSVDEGELSLELLSRQV